MTFEIQQLEEAIAGVVNEEAIGSPYFEACMRFLGFELAKALLEALEDNIPQTMRVVCSAEDYDILAGPFVTVLRGSGVECSLSCLWSKYNEETEYVPATSVLVAQVHDDGPALVDMIACISSSLTEDALIADHFSRSTTKIDASRYYVTSPFISEDEETAVRRQLEYRGSVQPHFFDLSPERKLRPKIDILSLVRGHLRLTYGNDQVGFVPTDFGGPKPEFTNDFEPPSFPI
jgi:hypothetical protein